MLLFFNSSCKGVEHNNIVNIYTFKYKTANLAKIWYENGYIVKYDFQDNVKGELGKITKGSLKLPDATKGKNRVGKITIGTYINNGFSIDHQLDIGNQGISIDVKKGFVCFYWYLEGVGTPVQKDFSFNWDSLFKGRVLTPEGIYATPIKGYDTPGLFLTPSLYWEYAVLNGYYGGKNVWLSKEAGWAFFYYPQLVSMVYIPLLSKGVIYTKPTSSYLKGLYGFGENFYDTRFNTDCADFLTQVGKYINEPAYLWAARKYKEYYIQHALKYHWNIGEGFLVSDYSWTKLPDIITHASLNHNLAEVNFLLRLEDNDGIEIAKKILIAIKTEKEKWINKDGDLNYAYYGNGDYHGKDYKKLTLRDLYATKSLLSKYEWGKEYLDTISYLIDAKEKFLAKTN